MSWRCPLTNAYRRYISWIAAHALVCRGPRLVAALAFHVGYSTSLLRENLPVGGYAGFSPRQASKAIDIVYLVRLVVGGEVRFPIAALIRQEPVLSFSNMLVEKRIVDIDE